jgi:hypothetical protein
VAAGAGVSLFVSSFFLGALMIPALAFAMPGLELLTEKLIHSVGGRIPDAAIGLALFMTSQWFRGKYQRLRQKDYDVTGQRILAALRADPAARVPDFYLYLRAFETTGKLHLPFYLRLRRKCIWVGQWLLTDDLEGYVTVAIGGRAPLVALGRPGEAVGAGRILTEDERWKSDIVTLMRRAKGILLVPSDREGTIWEIDTLRAEGLLGNVVFVMPPLSRGEYDTGARWAAAKQAMAVHGLEAPEHQDRGMLFRLAPDGKLLNAEPLILGSLWSVHRSLKRLSKPRKRKRIYQAIVKADRSAGRAAFWGWLENARQLSVFPVVALAVLLPASNVGFDPGESWATVFQRSLTMNEIGQDDASQLLNGSAKYQQLKASQRPENLDRWNQALLLRGLGRLDDASLRAYFIGHGEMLARVSERSCAEIASGRTQPGTMNVAFTYIPSDHVSQYLYARNGAIAAAAEDAPLANLDRNAETLGWQQFTGTLSPKDSLRYRELQNKATLSVEDSCWKWRTIYGAVGKLAEPQATLWARVVAKMLSGEPSPTPPEPVPAPDPPQPPQPVPPEPNHRTDYRSGPGGKTDTPYPIPDPPAPKPVPVKPPEPQPAPVTPSPQPQTPQTTLIETPPPTPAVRNPAPAVDPTIAMLERGRLALEVGNLVEPPRDCALYWALQLTLNGSPQGSGLEQSALSAMNKRISDARAAGNYASAIVDLNKLIAFYPDRTELVTLRWQIQADEQRASAEAQLKKFVLQHRHIVVGNNGALLQAYCVGVLVLLPGGAARFDCVSTLDPQGRCDHVVFAAGTVKNVKFTANGLLHVATSRSGNYDFYGESASLQGAYQGLGLIAGR